MLKRMRSAGFLQDGREDTMTNQPAAIKPPGVGSPAHDSKEPIPQTVLSRIQLVHMRMCKCRGGALTVYSLHLSNGSENWVVARRYSEFLRCHVQLLELFKRHELPPFPPKEPFFQKIFKRQQTREQWVAERHLQLHNYLATLLEHPGMSQTQALHWLLGAKSQYLADDEADGQDNSDTVSGIRVRLTSEPGIVDVAVRVRTASTCRLQLALRLLHAGHEEGDDHREQLHEDCLLDSCPNPCSSDIWDMMQELEVVPDGSGHSVEVHRKFTLQAGSLWQVGSVCLGEHGAKGNSVCIQLWVPAEEELSALLPCASRVTDNQECLSGAPASQEAVSTPDRIHSRDPCSKSDDHAIDDYNEFAFKPRDDADLIAVANGPVHGMQTCTVSHDNSLDGHTEAVTKASETAKIETTSRLQDGFGPSVVNQQETPFVRSVPPEICNHSPDENRLGTLGERTASSCAHTDLEPISLHSSSEDEGSVAPHTTQHFEQGADWPQDETAKLRPYERRLCVPRAHVEDEVSVKDEHRLPRSFMEGHLRRGPQMHKVVSISYKGQVAADYAETVAESLRVAVQRAPHRFEGKADGSCRSVPIKVSTVGPSIARNRTDSRPSVEELDEDRLERQMLQSREEEQMVAAWIHAVTGHVSSAEASVGQCTVQEALQSGEALCDLVNAIWPGSIVGILRGDVKAYRRVENLLQFTKACSNIGVHQNDLFAAPDLIEGKNLKKVVRCIFALHALVPASHTFEGPRLCEIPAT